MDKRTINSFLKLNDTNNSATVLFLNGSPRWQSPHPQFYKPEENINCLDDSECWMCWDTCHMFYTNFRVWGHMCEEKKLCFPGCQESCRFHNSHPELVIQEGHSDTGVVQPLKYSYQPESDAFRLQWTRPKEDYQVGQLVYVLLIRDELSGDWEQLQQTFYHNVTVRRGLIKSSSHIRLISYDSEGRTAEIVKLCSELNVSPNREYIEEMYKDQGYFDNIVPGYIGYRKGSSMEQWKPAVQSLRDSNKHVGGVDAVISWAHVPHKAQTKYVVEWKQADQTIDITGQLSTYNNVGTLTLWPNTMYQLTIRAFVPGIRDPIARSITIIINTADFDGAGLWIPINYVTIGAVTAFILTGAITFIVIRFYRRQRTRPVDTIPTIQPTAPNKIGSSFRHASVKRQLSSLGTRLSQGPLSPSVKHNRLIEEDPSFSSDPRHMPDSGCNV
ncbi:uncharacterized protein LOC111259739 isoform X1 [Varroa jacobsoni]|uniref:uncharacterized protein LOC111259739 isoform X1 n=1 Tax=Varroa jacobsoni TaxID=62625 RepID=UPI000BF53FEA|nr:uncharacterized protein LOC111259739 isoform X1 [Varroa jacobsoni]